MFGVWFGDKHSYKDFNLILTSKDIPLPEAKTYTVDVPGADGVLDLSTALTDGKIKYCNRELTLTFTVIQPWRHWEQLKSRLANYLHGKIMQVRLDADNSYYYVGRCRIDSFASDKASATLVVKVDAEPYKYNVHLSTEQVVWDTFNFETGIMCALSDLEIVNTLTVIVPAQCMRVVPTIICSEDMQLTYKQSMYSLYAGDNIIPDVQLSEDEEDNTLTFSGNGQVSIKFRGGAL